MMVCENNLCIYQQNNTCLLDYIELDTQGQCRECIYPSFDEQALEQIKEAYRKRGL